MKRPLRASARFVLMPSLKAPGRWAVLDRLSGAEVAHRGTCLQALLVRDLLEERIPSFAQAKPGPIQADAASGTPRR